MDCSHAWNKTMVVAMHVPWKHHRRRLHHRGLRGFQCYALSKAGQRFFTLVATKRKAGDTLANSRLIKKFVTSSPKSVALEALSHLLSHPHLSSLAFPLYLKITEAPWFVWNPTLVAQVAACLDRQCQDKESARLLSECISKLQPKERELALFYRDLIDSQSRHGSARGFEESCARLRQLVCDSSSVYVKRQGYRGMISGLCEVGKPGEAEELMREMTRVGIKASMFEFRCVLHGYGRLGWLKEMQRIIDEMLSEGVEVDSAFSNMILSSYGAHSALPEMVVWLRKMKSLGIPLSIRSYYSVLSSCPAILSLVQNNSKEDGLPISLGELMKVLGEDEAMLVEGLVGSSVLNEVMEWDALEGRLDLHGMDLGSAYLIMLQWMEELRSIFGNGSNVVPAEIRVVCGWGKHSRERGKSPLKRMVKEIMVRTGSPMRIDRENLGCFVAKGKVVRDWLV
ncbi:hypothetical protein Tsubulata_019456 [Turnera subulata]|uniref:Smr domain-containing protein n=1 Tax=Turnera subulata TaxID=218843 RepID=A0A9Q0GMH3_9ROSI|nr:hypothetical protein Tsubulata_019456 [Turnera subulata]